MLKLLTLTAAGLVAGTAHAATFELSATLNDVQTVPRNFSDATGAATLVVDDEDETLDFSLSVAGIFPDLDAVGGGDFADVFFDGDNAALGPIHLHFGDAGEAGPVVVPFPTGRDDVTYTETDAGFDLTTNGYTYAEAVGISGATAPFDAFLGELLAGNYYINIHTDVAPSGEIRGQLETGAVAPVPLPAGGLLILGAFGALAAFRRKG